MRKSMVRNKKIKYLTPKTKKPIDFSHTPFEKGAK
jgi:hypothetical protein